MKILNKILILSLMLFLVAGCEQGIDPITAVDPGPDMTAPVVTVNFPIEGTQIRVDEEITSITIKFVASDDIELKSISVKLDGTEISAYSSFIDYRRFMTEFVYNNVTNGDHELTVTATDLAGKITTQTVHFEKIAPYSPLPGEVLYLPFDGDFSELVAKRSATVVGAPGFTDGRVMQAFANTPDAYITFQASDYVSEEFSAAFWYKINPVPDRAGILAINPIAANADDGNRKFGIRFAREAAGAQQKFFLNIGNGASDSWFVPSSFTPGSDWMHIAISISTTTAAVYINGVVASEGAFTGPIDWTGCDLIAIGSGAPNFIYWDHKSDLSLYDDLRMFNKALTAEEVSDLYSMK